MQSKPHYVAVIKNVDRLDIKVVMHRLDERSKTPCISFRKYSGARTPKCQCLPCLERYLEVCRGRKGHVVNHLEPGVRVVPMPPSEAEVWAKIDAFHEELHREAKGNLYRGTIAFEAFGT